MGELRAACGQVAWLRGTSRHCVLLVIVTVSSARGWPGHSSAPVNWSPRGRANYTQRVADGGHQWRGGGGGVMDEGDQYDTPQALTGGRYWPSFVNTCGK